MFHGGTQILSEWKSKLLRWTNFSNIELDYDAILTPLEVRTAENLPGWPRNPLKKWGRKILQKSAQLYSIKISDT